MAVPTDSSNPGSSKKHLEEKIAFVEHHVGELDALVRELFERAAALQSEIARLRDNVGQRFEEIDRRPEDDVPPHWGR